MINIKEDMKKISYILIISLIILKIVFYKESLWNIVKLILSFAWLVLLPGFSIMYYWKESLNFAERILIGTALGTVLFAGISYYLGLLAINIKYHVIFVPIALICLGIFILHKKGGKENKVKIKE